MYNNKISRLLMLCVAYAACSTVAQRTLYTNHVLVMKTIKKEVNALQRSNETSGGDEWWIPSSKPPADAPRHVCLCHHSPLISLGGL